MSEVFISCPGPQSKHLPTPLYAARFHTTSTCGVGVSVLSDEKALLCLRGYSLEVSVSSSWAWGTRIILDDNDVKSFCVEMSLEFTSSPYNNKKTIVTVLNRFIFHVHIYRAINRILYRIT